MGSAPLGKKKGNSRRGRRATREKDAHKGKGDGQTDGRRQKRAHIKVRVFATGASRAAVNISLRRTHPRGKYGEGSVPDPPAGNTPLRPPYSAFSASSPVCVQNDEPFLERENKSNCEQSSLATRGRCGFPGHWRHSQSGALKVAGRP